MKVANENITVLASFERDGKITPLRFKREDGITIQIDKIIKIHEELPLGRKRIVYTCLQNNKDKYELKFEVETQKWYLFI